MDTDLKTALFAAGGMMALSALIGILYGVSFLALVFRAFLFGLLSGGFMFGSLKLARNLVPDLFSDAADGGRGKVDIVISDEIREESPEADAVEGAENRFEETADDAVPIDQGSDEVDDELAREAEALRGERLVHDDDEPERPRGDLRPPDVFDDLDVLPDMTAFTDAFGDSRGGPRGDSGAVADDASTIDAASDEMPGVSYGTRGSSRSGNDSGAGDPTELAKAIRTILTKDAKG